MVKRGRKTKLTANELRAAGVSKNLVVRKIRPEKKEDVMGSREENRHGPGVGGPHG